MRHNEFSLDTTSTTFDSFDDVVNLAQNLANETRAYAKLIDILLIDIDALRDALNEISTNYTIVLE
ncbi:hypothetical protein LCGC14_2497250 [marine sediment metagenome]|uniref:Uncharacterized protein n=1 Tax=marine sediment metagenome TaxID=412755 RepID=A0A0F9DES4_9ZZZZ